MYGAKPITFWVEVASNRTDAILCFMLECLSLSQEYLLYVVFSRLYNLMNGSKRFKSVTELGVFYNPKSIFMIVVVASETLDVLHP